MKLNLGSGRDYKEGWINVDIVREFRADLYHNLLDGLPYPDESTDAIMAKDILEHFTKSQIPGVFEDWVRVLRRGGILEVFVPNMDAIKRHSGESFLNLVFGEPEFSGVDTGPYGLHKWGFYEGSLKELFRRHNLEILQLRSSSGTNLYCKGMKKQ